MKDFNGIVSLLVACIELGLFVNLLIFAEKNHVNKLVISLIGLLFLYQVFEFIICFVEAQSAAIVYISLVTISILPPLSLLIILRFYKYNSKIFLIIFMPALYFLIYYLFAIENIAVMKCTVLYIIYNYPLGTLYGAFYYIPVLVSIIILIIKLKQEKSPQKKTLSIIILSGYVITSIPGLLINLFVPGAIAAVESILCKLALIFAVTFALFALKNKTESET
ncbi:hypothetical protein ACFLTH_07740 [Bacteroidota bacterium]